MSDRFDHNHKINDKNNSEKQQSENVLDNLGGQLLGKPDAPNSPNQKVEQAHAEKSEKNDAPKQTLEKADAKDAVSQQEKAMTDQVMKNAPTSWADKADVLRKAGALDDEKVKELAKMFPYAAEMDAFKNAFQVKK